MEQNPYAPPTTDADSSFSGDDPGTSALRAFVGPGANRYLQRWSKARSGQGQAVSLHIGAFFFGPVWFAYRKLYRELTVVLLGIVGLGAAQVVYEEMSGEAFPTEIDGALNVGIGVALALVANPLYLRRAKLVIAAVQVGDEEERLREIARRGGTSWPSVLALLAFGGLVLFALIE